MRIQHNLSAMNLQRHSKINNRNLLKNIVILSSGYRINSAADDAAGLAISEKMRAQIRGLKQASRNLEDGIGIIQIADGALAEVQDMMNRMKELSVQSASDTNTQEDRAKLQEELDQLLMGINRIAHDTEINEKRPLLKQDDPAGNSEKGLWIQAGANAGQGFYVELCNATQGNLELNGLDITTQVKAKEAIEKIDKASSMVSRMRGKFGAYQNRMEHAIAANDNTAENLQAAESRIRDADMAKAMMEYTKESILQQIKQSLMAQVFMAPQSILGLLQ